MSIKKNINFALFTWNPFENITAVLVKDGIIQVIIGGYIEATQLLLIYSEVNFL